MPAASNNRWLDARRSRLLPTLGQTAERSGEAEQALLLYAESNNSEARIRRLRVLERLGRYQEGAEVAQAALGQARERNPSAWALVAALGAQVEPARPPGSESSRGPDPRAGASRPSIGRARRCRALIHRQYSGVLCGKLPNHRAFGLLLWPAIFKPLPGAFFHPFHSGPADLYREDFVRQRQAEIDACLAQLDDGRYRETMRATWHAKQGITSPFVHGVF